LEIKIKFNLKFDRYNTYVKIRNFEMCMIPHWGLSMMGEICLYSIYKSREYAIWLVAPKSRSQVLGLE